MRGDGNSMTSLEWRGQAVEALDRGLDPSRAKTLPVLGQSLTLNTASSDCVLPDVVECVFNVKAGSVFVELSQKS